MILLHCLLMTLLQCLHLLLLLVTAMNRLSDGTTDRAADILTAMIVAEHIP